MVSTIFDVPALKSDLGCFNCVADSHTPPPPPFVQELKTSIALNGKVPAKIAGHNFSTSQSLHAE